MGLANLKHLFWACMVAGMVSPPAFPHPHQEGKVSCIFQVSLPYATHRNGKDHIFYLHGLRDGLSTLMTPDPAVLYCPVKRQALPNPPVDEGEFSSTASMIPDSDNPTDTDGQC